MSEKTLTRADLAEAVYQEVGLSRKNAVDMVEKLLDTMSDTLVKGNTIKVSGFGNFAVRQKNERIGRNPKTGQEVPITARRVLIFRASHLLKDAVNRG
jgi:integration host factor subunit alpha